MPYCRNCKKMVANGAFDASEIEVLIEDGVASLFGPLVITCPACKGPVTTAALGANVDLKTIFADVRPQPDPVNGEVPSYEFAESPRPLEVTDRKSDTYEVKTGRHKGEIRPVTRPEQATRYYGVRTTVAVTRTILNKENEPVGEPAQATITLAAEEKASGFKHIDGTFA